MFHVLALVALLPLNTNNEAPVKSGDPIGRLSTSDEPVAVTSISKEDIEAMPVQSLSDLMPAVQSGKTWLKLRYRFEDVSQTGKMDAHASTLRTLLGYETGNWNNFTGTVEFEDVSPIGNDTFNSKLNGNTGHATVADPDVSEVNQVFLKYKLGDHGAIKVGRQRIKLGNLRWVGNVGWRQNEQTYDGATGAYDFDCGVSVVYGVLTNVNNVIGENVQLNSHALLLSKEMGDAGKLSLFGLRLDQDVPAAADASTSTIGLRFDGSRKLSDAGSLLYAAEYANQKDTAGNQNEVDADYTLLEAGWKAERFTVKAAYEMLGSSTNGNSLQTPLATLHKFNGWADKFLMTPVEGLVDMNLSVGTEVAGAKVKAIYHQFDSDEGSLDFGSEVDLDVVYPVNDHVKVGARFADYSAKDSSFSVNLDDTRKLWFWMSFSK